LNEGTLSSRLAMARKLLAKPLARGGLLLPATALGVLAGAVAEASMPASLVHATVAAATGGPLPAKVAALTQGVLTAMFLNKLQTATVVLLTFAVLALGAGVLLNRAVADKPPAAAADAAAKDKPEKGATVHGVVKSFDADKNRVTVTVRVNPDKKQTEEKTYDLAKDAKVIRDEARTKADAPIEGKPADLIEGTEVSLELTADGKQVARIVARGPGLLGYVKSVDAKTPALTIASKGKDGVKEVTLTIAKDAKVLLNDGLKKGTEDKEGKLEDLTEGTPVHVQLSVDRQRALDIRPQGEGVHGVLKGYDSGNATLTLTYKGDGGIVEKSYTVAKDAHLTDLSEGAPVAVRLSVFDKKMVVEAHGVK
jgi:hypothetical protein